MNPVFSSIRFAITTRKAWWFTATSRTKSRFARTTLGSFWLGVSNLLSVAVLATVYGTVFKVTNFSEYVVYLGIGLVIWNSISASVSSSPTLFDHNANNLKNVNLHPIFYTLEEWAFQVQSFLQSFSLVILCLSIFQRSLIFNCLIFSLPSILNLLLFMFWFPILICLLGVRYHDILQLVPILLQLLFLLSPILYVKSNLGHLSWFADYNIFYQYLSSVRFSMIHGIYQIPTIFTLLLLNLIGIYISLVFLSRSRTDLPFLV